MALHPPAFCPEHGLFAATLFEISPNLRGTTFEGVDVTCPRCGRDSEIIPGVYDTTDDRLNILVDRSISPEALANIKGIAERLQQGAISTEQAKAEAERILPKLGKLFDVWNWSDQAKATLWAAIIGSVSVIVAARIASSPSQTLVVQPVIERTVETKRNQLLSSTAPPKNVPLPRERPKR